MKRIVVIHPDLGLGGAERLIVDASKALQDRGNEVRIFTGYHDVTRCFEETRDGTLETVVVGKWIPRNVFGKCHALLAYLKIIYIALYLIVFSKHDLVLCDQVSACIPILKLDFRNKPRIVFYCHFPDQLLTTRTTLLKSLYRRPLDLFERWSTNLADIILVNSNFTSKIVKRTFPSLKNRDLQVLYPCVDVNKFIRFKTPLANISDIVRFCVQLSEKKFVFLSLNRFERKKDLILAVRAIAECLSKLNERRKNNVTTDLHLVLAGGYDERLADCLDYYAEIEQTVNELDDESGVKSHVTFVKSPTETEKFHLLRACDAVIYTPENEHFGIVPLEAMAMKKPVIASASGGPLETIENGQNGFLCEHDKSSFADAMLELYSDRKLAKIMGEKGLKRVQAHFSYETFRERLDEICFQQPK